MDSVTGLAGLYSSLTGFYVLLFFLIIITVMVLLVIGLQLSRTNKELKELFKKLVKQKP